MRKNTKARQGQCHCTLWAGKFDNPEASWMVISEHGQIRRIVKPIDVNDIWTQPVAINTLASSPVSAQ